MRFEIGDEVFVGCSDLYSGFNQLGRRGGETYMSFRAGKGERRSEYLLYVLTKNDILLAKIKKQERGKKKTWDI